MTDGWSANFPQALPPDLQGTPQAKILELLVFKTLEFRYQLMVSSEGSSNRHRLRDALHGKLHPNEAHEQMSLAKQTAEPTTTPVSPVNVTPQPQPQSSPQDLRKRQIEAVARKQLRQSSYPAVRDVDCQYQEPVLTLRGRIPSYYLKQIAQTIVLDRLEGMVTINNQLIVDEK